MIPAIEIIIMSGTEVEKKNASIDIINQIKTPVESAFRRFITNK